MSKPAEKKPVDSDDDGDEIEQLQYKVCLATYVFLRTRA